MLGTEARTISAVTMVPGTPQDLFDVPQLVMGSVGGEGLSMFSYRMTGIELRGLNVTVRPVTSGGTEVRCYGDLRSGMWGNWKISKGIASVMGALGGGFGGAIAVGVASLGWYRWLYRYRLRKATDELNQMLGQLGRHLRSQAVFGPATGRPRRLGQGT